MEDVKISLLRLLIRQGTQRPQTEITLTTGREHQMSSHIRGSTGAPAPLTIASPKLLEETGQLKSPSKNLLVRVS